MIWSSSIDPEEGAGRLFARCFSNDELEFLKKQPRFVEAVRHIKTLDEAINAVEFGGKLMAEVEHHADFGI